MKLSHFFHLIISVLMCISIVTAQSTNKQASSSSIPAHPSKLSSNLLIGQYH